MTLTFDRSNIRIGYAGGMHKTHRKKAADSTCATGGFYKSPTAGQSVQSGTNFDISWDTTCLTTDSVDIYLYAPSTANPRIHLWQNVNYALGNYNSTLAAAWWNSTSSVDLQLAIVAAGSPPFLSTLPAGPIFAATVGTGDSSSGQAVTSSSAITNVNNFFSSHGLSGGKIAAAVIMPILVLSAIIFAAWFKFQRAKTQDKRKRFSEAVDKRMSTISTDWKSISAAGATAAIRNSVAVSGTAGNRASSFSFGNIRPSSTLATDGGHAGVGTKGTMFIHNNGSFSEKSEMSQTSKLYSGPRPNFETDRLPRVSFATDRVSRVSFAPDTRPSGESRRGVSRAFHFGEAPPMPQPSRMDSSEMSPTQTEGPMPLTADDIRNRMSTHERPSMDDYMPALSMMRHGGDGVHNGNDLLLSPRQPAPPTPTVAKPPVGAMPMQPMSASVMSPDAMLRAYAESRRNMGTTPTNNGFPAFPMPAASYDGNGMRTLFSPPPSYTTTTPSPASNNPYKKSSAVSEFSKYEDEDAYIGTAN